MIVYAIADMHGQLPEIPPCDLLLIAGDVCPDFPSKSGKYALPDKGALEQGEWLYYEFREWLEAVPAKQIVGIAGNHDFVFETDDVPPLLPWLYLKDQRALVGGLSIYGDPHVPGLPRWAFYASDMALEARATMMPKCDVMMLHGPPWGYLDFVAPQFGSTHVGDVHTVEAIRRVRPKVMICGHIHEQYGRTADPISGTVIYNVAHVDEFYEARSCTPTLIPELSDI